MSIDANKIKELRNRTQAGFADCKNALEATNNDIEKAIVWLREKGIAKAAKKASSIAAEGMVCVKAKGDYATIIEVNCQTDFASKNKTFVKFVNDIVNVVLTKKTINKYENFLLTNKKAIKDNEIELTAAIGEKIKVRRIEIIKKNKNQTFGIYQHFNNRIASIVLIDGKVDSEVSKNIAMQVVAMNPKFTKKSEVDSKWLENEQAIQKQQLLSEKKDIKPEFLPKVILGKVNKMLSEICLEDQPYVKENKMSVKQYLANYKGSVNQMIRFEVGEGIEKKVTNFAEEVNSQIKKK